MSCGPPGFRCLRPTGRPARAGSTAAGPSTVSRSNSTAIASTAPATPGSRTACASARRTPEATTSGASPTATSPTTRARCSPSSGRCSYKGLEQPHLAQDRDRVRVDVLALDEAVLERDHVHPVPRDAVAGRLGHEVAAGHAVHGGRSGRPLLRDEPLPDVEATGRERDVGPAGEDRPDVLA